MYNKIVEIGTAVNQIEQQNDQHSLDPNVIKVSE